VPWSGTPDSVRCTRTVQDQTRQSRVSPAPLRYNSPDCPVCHRTVRCTSGATAPSCNGRLQKLKKQSYSAQTVCGRAEQPSEALRTVNSTCPVPLEDKGSNGRLCPNPNGWVTWLAHRTVRYAHRQQPPPTVVLVVEGYKYPQPPPLQPSKHSSHFIQYKSKVQHSKTQIKATDPIKVPNSILVL
jgi:hypothetical protein